MSEYGAEMIALQLTSIDPNGMNRPAREAADIAKKVIAAVDVPVILWGVGNHEKDTEVLRIIAEECEGKNLALGPVEEGDYKQIGAGALAYKHVVIASSPIDVNLAKQLNILLGNLGVPADKILDRPDHRRPRLRPGVHLLGDGARPHGRPHPGGREAADPDHLQRRHPRSGRPRRRRYPRRTTRSWETRKSAASCWNASPP